MSKLTRAAAGVYIIAATPFKDDGRIDYDGIPVLFDFYLNHGVHGLTILGMMGEAPKLTMAEQQEIAAKMLAYAAGKVPVVVGVSASGFAAIAELSDYVMAKGAAGVMIAPPPTIRGDQALRGYFKNAVAAIGPDTPFVIQDFPLATGVIFSAEIIQELAETYPSCAMLKHEDWPGLDKISKPRAMHDRGRERISILTGNGGIFLTDELARGADGAMTGFAYPELLVSLCDLIGKGETARAHDLFDAYLPLIRYEQQPVMGLMARKYVLKQRGALASAVARQPSPPLSPQSAAEIDFLMERLARKLAALSA